MNIFIYKLCIFHKHGFSWTYVIVSYNILELFDAFLSMKEIIFTQLEFIMPMWRIAIKKLIKNLRYVHIIMAHVNLEFYLLWIWGLLWPAQPLMGRGHTCNIASYVHTQGINLIERLESGWLLYLIEALILYHMFHGTCKPHHRRIMDTNRTCGGWLGCDVIIAIIMHILSTWFYVLKLYYLFSRICFDYLISVVFSIDIITN